jgi:hypothetical protein
LPILPVPGWRAGARLSVIASHELRARAAESGDDADRILRLAGLVLVGVLGLAAGAARLDRLAFRGVHHDASR